MNNALNNPRQPADRYSIFFPSHDTFPPVTVHRCTLSIGPMFVQTPFLLAPCSVRSCGSEIYLLWARSALRVTFLGS